MKRSGWLFTLGVMAFLVVVFAVMQTGTHKFNWDTTYDPNSCEPFGTVLLDSFFSETLPGGYEMRKTDIMTLAADTAHVHHLLFLPNDVEYISYSEFDELLDIVHRGSTVMIVDGGFDVWSDTLQYKVDWSETSYFNFKTFMRQLSINGKPLLDTLVWKGQGAYPQDTAMVWSVLSAQTFFFAPTSDCEMSPLICTESGRSSAVAIPFGKGKVVLVTNSLMFTNFGVLDSPSRKLVLRLMNEFGKNHVMRVCHNDELDRQGMFNVIRRHPPLRTAWRIALVGVVLALIVNARRRQRAIPLLKKSRNVTLDFIRQHASLFRSHTDHASLVQRKYRAFAALLRRKWQVDVEDRRPAIRREQALRLAAYLHRTAFDVMADLDELDRLRHTGGFVSPELFAEAMRLMQRLDPDD